VLVEKILRVQPDVKKLFLLVRAADDESAKQRVETEVKKARYLLPSSFRPVVVSIIACFSCAN
jgi:thioester reductase-like protein